MSGGKIAVTLNTKLFVDSLGEPYVVETTTVMMMDQWNRLNGGNKLRQPVKPVLTAGKMGAWGRGEIKSTNEIEFVDFIQFHSRGVREVEFDGVDKQFILENNPVYMAAVNGEGSLKPFQRPAAAAAASKRRRRSEEHDFTTE